MMNGNRLIATNYYSVKKFPTLYGKASTGKIKEWEIEVVEENGVGYIHTKHGLQGGKKQQDAVIVREGKNIGRANETTPVEQAISQATSKWNKKVDKGYAEDIKDIPVNRLPMLAKRYKDDKKHITFPCFVQPKLDGVRCLAKRVNGNIEFTSRAGKRFETIEHINKQLKSIMKVEDIFDGEIYIHGENFQDIVSAIKNVKNKEKSQLDCNKLEYHIYDYADSNMPFYLRRKVIESKITKGTHLIPVKTIQVYSDIEIQLWHSRFVKDGYEGIIIRNKKGGYEFDHRSNNLQKKKDFLDEEFIITGVKCGVGRYEKCATFICETKDGKEFDVNPKGTIEKKQQYLKDGEKNFGKMLTVKFQEKSKDGIPRFPVGMVVRDYE